MEDKYLDAKILFESRKIHEALLKFEEGLMDGDVKCAYGMLRCISGLARPKIGRKIMSAGMEGYIKEIERLANQGDVEAMLILSCCKMNAIGTDVDVDQSFILLHRAIDYGSESAFIQLMLLYKSHKKEAIEVDKRLGLYKELDEYPMFKKCQ